ncbi:MAG: hypothetical protein HYW33_02220 [Candidatus Blackburnbacteria bacterium]|nr:hypothetical protein [Candidatus Blackburnbacteria bacterium]
MKKTVRLRSASAGQALLIILLVMAVVLTIALSVASRSITDITVSQKEEESARAFSAAEAGVEQAIIGNTTAGSLDSGAEYAIETGRIEGNEFIFPSLLSAGEVAPVWFVAHDADGNQTCGSSYPCFTGSSLTVCWGASGTPSDGGTTPAVEVSMFYTTGSGGSTSTKIARGAYDPNSSRRGSNRFDPAGGSCSIAGTDFAFSKTVNFSDFNPVVPNRTSSGEERGPQFARLRILYNTDRGHPIGVSVVGGTNFPSQGTKIESTGTVGETTRKIEFSRLFSDLPPIFDSAVFSGVGGITKSE